MENKNEPAYTIPYENLGNTVGQGLTKQELFAAMAMQGMLSNSAYLNGVSQVAIEDNESGSEMIAKAAISIADALLKELEK